MSNRTREHLRNVVIAFLAAGRGDLAAPFFRHGAGTINILVLAAAQIAP